MMGTLIGAPTAFKLITFLDKEVVLDYDGTRLTEAKAEEIASRNSELRSAQTKNN